MAKIIYASTAGPVLAIDLDTGQPCELDQPEPYLCERCGNTCSDLAAHLADPQFTGHEGHSDGSA
jgi:hypothetical protein